MKSIFRPLLLPLSVWTAATALGANWPAWRGPEANGVSSKQNLPITGEKTAAAAN